MKKTLLTLSAVLGISAGAFGQGYVLINTPSSAGFNTLSSSSTTATGWYTGNLSLQIYSIAASAGNFTLAQTIDSDAAAGTQAGTVAAEGLITGNFTEQNLGTTLAGETSSVLFNIVGGDFNTVASGGGQPAGSYYVGSSTSISGNVLYAIIVQNALGTLQGALVFDNGGAGGYAIGVAPPGTANLMANDWGNAQNIFLTPVPEPTTLALAGLGGLSMLFLRRRKA